ncbi:hypothetical protein EK21DRAFT_77914 [Setomelanomma holmii]|uniref:Rhodopsin domain-containing protein n=1 Tax=Setomelanomma holmii TaxID=210430 RepID=A0A9P4H0H9_9PLEO|nr:hypothetical protein EK21DRAFT_77914 [Setomelanomma holmii]
MAVDYFTNPPPGLDLTTSRTATNNAIGIVLFVLSLVFVILRLITRLRLKNEALGLDDYLMFAGLVLNAGNLACCIAGGFFGLGKHIWSLGPYEMRQITIITFAYVYIYAWSICIIKFSILALYRRIFGLSWLGYFCLVLTTGYLITFHIVLPLYARPTSYYWNQWYGADGKLLVDEAKFYLVTGIINLFGDVMILIVPVQSVVKLQMGRTQKIAICLMFLLGSFVCFASLYRIVTIAHLVETTDISWAKSDVFIWSSVEPSVGIISGCLPTLRPLLKYILETWFKYVPSTNKSTGNSSRPYPLSPLETISKKRTRKINKKNDLESTNFTMTNFTQLEDDVDDHRVTITTARNDRDDSGNWRPDEDEMCLTTTKIHRSESEHSANGEHGLVENLERDGITMTTKFEWDENVRR